MERSNLRKATFFLHLSILLFSFVAFATNRFDQVIVTNSQSVGTGSVPNSLAVLDLISTTKGMLPPRMTTTQRNAIGSPPEALVVYDTTLHSPKYYNGGSWLDFGFQSPLTTLGDIMYENSTPAAARLPGNTSSTKKYLGQTGTGSVSAAPVWSQPACSELSDAVASCSTDTTNASNISSGTLAIARGGTNSTSVTTSPAITAWAGWDANKDLSANNFLAGYATTATAAGTTVLTVSSAELQYFTGVTTQTVTLPVTSTLVLGQSFTIVNKSTGAVTVQSSGANTVQAVAANAQAIVTCISTSGTGATSWSVYYSGSGGGGVTSVDMTVPTFLTVSGNPITTSGTLAVTLSGTALPIANGGTGQTSASAAFNALSCLTTGGDTIYGGTSGACTRLANGSSGTVLTSAGGTSAPTWTLANAGLLTGLSITNGTIAATDTILQGFNKALGIQSVERDPNEIKNCVIKTAVSTNNLTVSLRDAGGSAAPTAGSPCVVAMQNSAGINNNKWVETSVSASTSVTASSGSTLGCSSGVECYIFVYLQDDGSLCLSGSGTWDQGQLYTTTTIGASSTSGSTIYCSTGGAGHAVGQIGRIRVTEASAGVYASATTETYNGTQTSYISKSFISSKTGNRDNWVIATDSSATNGLLAHMPVGTKNYITNPDFESNSTTGWSLGNVALTSNLPSGTPTFGSGANVNLTLQINTASQLAGTYALWETSSTATTAGDFVASNPFTIDPDDQAKVLTFKFYYNVHANPSNGNFSGTSSNSFGVAIYNVTQGGSNWIIPAGIWCETQANVTGVGICTGTFQTSASDTQYRIVVYNANATAGTITVYYDDFYLGPQTAPIGAPITDWASFTPTGTWSTNTTYTGFWRRVGGDMEVQTKLALVGAPTSASLSINIPTGYTIDTTRIAGTAASASPIGIGGGKSAGQNAHFVVSYNSTSAVTVQYISSVTSAAKALVSQAAPATFANGDEVTVLYKIPITGWSSNVQMSSDTDTRVAAFRVHKAANQTGINTNSSSVQLLPDTVDIDTHGGFASNAYTIPVSGVWQFGAFGQLATSNVLANVYEIRLNKNGSFFATLGGTTPAAGTNADMSGTLTTSVNAGDTITWFVFGGGNNSASNVTMNGGAPSGEGMYFWGNRLSGPAVVAATETVAARYTGSSTSISASFANITFSTKDYDTHNAYSSGTYTIPVSGKYQINASLLINAATTSAGTGFKIQILKNGSLVSGPRRHAWTAAADDGSIEINDIINCNAGDTITIQALAGGTTPAIENTSPTTNYFSIVREGN